MGVIAAILAIGVLIIVHEAGHYFVARWCKMRVDRFSIGFGPALLKWRRGETDFTLGPIPFGGFVQIHGMTIAENVSPDDRRAYPNRPAWQRFLTILAGPGMNYVFAVVIGLVLFTAAGGPSGTIWYQVGEVRPGFDAQGKLEPGDRFVKLDGQSIHFRHRGEQAKESLPDMVDASRGRPVQITVLRRDKEHVFQIHPKLADNEEKKRKTYQLGITLALEEDSERVPVGVGKAVGMALAYPVAVTARIGGGLWDMITGKQGLTVSGPVDITRMVKHAYDVGWVRMLDVLMMLNVALGLFNLLPLPALDGGRLVFLGYEMTTRHRANPRIEATVHMVGIMCLLLLMVLVTYKEIAGLF